MACGLRHVSTILLSDLHQIALGKRRYERGCLLFRFGPLGLVREGNVQVGSEWR